jgi:hypothetical protein
MSDFDQFFRERLQEEVSNQPAQRRSWLQLDQRMQAWSDAQQVGSRRQWWRRANVLSQVAAWTLVGYLAYQNQQIHTDLEAIEQKIEQLGSAQTTQYNPSIASIPAVSNTQNQQTQSIDNQALSRIFYVEMPQSGSTPKSGAEPTIERSAPAASESMATNDGVAAESDISTLKKEDATLSNNGSIQNISLDLLPLSRSSWVRSITDKKYESPKIAPVLTSPIIHKANTPMTRLSAGIHATYMRPLAPNTGIDRMLGQGLSIQYDLPRRFNIFANADWIHFTALGDSTLRGPHLLEVAPSQDSMHHEWHLNYVETTRRQHFYAIGLGYELPLKSALRPTIRLAHTWSVLPSATIIYEYNEPTHPPGGGHGSGGSHGSGGNHGGGSHGGGSNHGDPNYETIALNHPKKKLSGNWQLGIGARYDLGRWVLRGDIDYTNGSTLTGRMFPILNCKIGAAYQF